MHVLHFFKTYWPDSFGGVERTIHAIASASARHGVGTTVLSLSRAPQARSVTFDGHEAPKARLDLELASTGLSLSAIPALSRAAEKADIVHYHFPWPMMDVAHFAARHGKPSIVTYHSDVVRQRLLGRFYAPLMHGFLQSVDRIVATSPAYARTSPVLRRHGEKVAVVPIGLADIEAADEQSEAKWRARFPRPFFLFTGVLRYYKGLQYLLEAAPLVPAEIVIVGAGPMEAELKAQGEGAGLSNVHFVGAVDDADKNALLGLCAGFVFPASERSEAFGLALLEASIAGRPLISTEVGSGTSYVNADGETGIVVPPRDPQALAGAMNALLADPVRAAAFGRAARLRYEALFTAERMGAAYAALYRELAGRRS
ncbi:glycosyltransferase [Aureimonas mangrovi]|uniref:glycosyltransferase n=1 Tax=Aureimonas mangrovi TaxID=2758041 RepID=UPI00163D6504|nr:glycosyltransferase [Aureimonas mangrovi]